MKLTLSVEQLVIFATLIFGFGGTMTLTHYRISALEHQVSEINGALQYVLAEGIREGRWEPPPVNWIEPGK